MTNMCSEELVPVAKKHKYMRWEEMVRWQKWQIWGMRKWCRWQIWGMRWFSHYDVLIFVIHMRWFSYLSYSYYEVLIFVSHIYEILIFVILILWGSLSVIWGDSLTHHCQNLASSYIHLSEMFNEKDDGNEVHKNWGWQYDSENFASHTKKIIIKTSY